MAHTIFDTPVVNLLLSRVSRLILRLVGWRLVGELPAEPKYMLIVAPHTSNWDFVIGLLIVFAYRIRLTWMGKHTIFVFPFGIVMRWLGGVPIDRRASCNLVDATAQMFRDAQRLTVAMAPEGTRKRVDRWRSGFYWMAHKGQVPIALGYIDYARRQAGVGPLFWPSGDYQQDMLQMQSFYQDKTARYPEQFNSRIV